MKLCYDHDEAGILYRWIELEDDELPKKANECECRPCPQCGVVGCPLQGIKITPHRKKKRKHTMRMPSGNPRAYWR